MVAARSGAPYGCLSVAGVCLWRVGRPLAIFCCPDRVEFSPIPFTLALAPWRLGHPSAITTVYAMTSSFFACTQAAGGCFHQSFQCSFFFHLIVTAAE